MTAVYSDNCFWSFYVVYYYLAVLLIVFESNGSQIYVNQHFSYVEITDSGSVRS